MPGRRLSHRVNFRSTLTPGTRADRLGAVGSPVEGSYPHADPSFGRDAKSHAGDQLVVPKGGSTCVTSQWIGHVL